MTAYRKHKSCTYYGEEPFSSLKRRSFPETALCLHLRLFSMVKTESSSVSACLSCTKLIAPHNYSKICILNYSLSFIAASKSVILKVSTLRYVRIDWVEKTQKMKDCS